MKRLLFLAALSTLLHAAGPHIITIAGTGAVVALSATDQQASSFQVTAPAGNSGIARLGDSTVTSSIGEALPAGSGQYFAPMSQASYSLKLWSVYVANGDVITVVWADPQ